MVIDTHDIIRLMKLISFGTDPETLESGTGKVLIALFGAATFAIAKRQIYVGATRLRHTEQWTEPTEIIPRETMEQVVFERKR